MDLETRDKSFHYFATRKWIGKAEYFRFTTINARNSISLLYLLQLGCFHILFYVVHDPTPVNQTVHGLCCLFFPSLLLDPRRLRFKVKIVAAPRARTMPQKPTRRSSRARGQEGFGTGHEMRPFPHCIGQTDGRTDGRRGTLIHSKSIIKEREKERKRALEPNKGPSLVTLSAQGDCLCPLTFLPICILCNSSNS